MASMRRFLTLGCVGVLAAALAGIAASSRAGGTPPAACQATEQRTHDEAVFGHFSSRSQGLALALRARTVGFMGIKIEDEGCGDYEVEIDGADKVADRVSFAAEAQKAGYPVTFEQIGAPLPPARGEAVGTFGSFPTLTAANALALRLAATNFRYIDIVKTGAGWSVVMPQVPVKHALSIAAEAHKAGFTITFVTG